MYKIKKSILFTLILTILMSINTFITADAAGTRIEYQLLDNDANYGNDTFSIGTWQKKWDINSYLDNYRISPDDPDSQMAYFWLFDSQGNESTRQYYVYLNNSDFLNTSANYYTTSNTFYAETLVGIINQALAYPGWNAIGDNVYYPRDETYLMLLAEYNDAPTGADAAEVDFYIE